MKDTDCLFRKTIQTEKFGRQAACLTFEVDLRASKPQLRNYFALLFGHRPRKCTTIICRNRKIAHFFLDAETIKDLQALVGPVTGVGETVPGSKISKEYGT